MPGMQRYMPRMKFVFSGRSLCGRACMFTCRACKHSDGACNCSPCACRLYPRACKHSCEAIPSSWEAWKRSFRAIGRSDALSNFTGGTIHRVAWRTRASVLLVDPIATQRFETFGGSGSSRGHDRACRREGMLSGSIQPLVEPQDRQRHHHQRESQQGRNIRP